METDLFTSGWLPRTPLEWFFAFAALCSVFIAIKSAWSLARRAWRSLVWNVQTVTLHVHIDWPLRETKTYLADMRSALAFRLDPQTLIAFAVDQISRMLFALGLLLFIILITDNWILGFVLGIGPLLALVNRASRLSGTMLTMADPVGATRKLIRRFEKSLERINRADPAWAKIGSAFREQIEDLKWLEAKFKSLEEKLTGRVDEEKMIAVSDTLPEDAENSDTSR